MTGQPGGDERDAAALDRFWDQVVSGGAAQNPAVDPGDARVVEALHRQAQRQRPDPRFVARLEGQLMASPARSLAPADLRSRLSVKNGHISPLARVEAVAAPPVRRGQQALWRLATAALLLLAVSLGALAFQRSPSGREGAGLASIPAVVLDSATPAPDLAGQTRTLFATVIPAERLPAGGFRDIVLNRLALAPGAVAPGAADVQACCPGPQMTHVLAGELTLRVDGPVQIVRGGAAGAAAKPAPPGDDVVLHAGDTAIMDFTWPATYRNAGTTPVDLVSAGLYGGMLPGPWAEGLELLDGNEEIPQPPLPPGAADVRLAEFTLPPGGRVPAPPPGSVVLEVGAAGDASIGKLADGGLRNIGPKTEHIYVLTVTPAPAVTATPAA